MGMLKKLIKVIVAILLLLIAIPVIFITYMTATDYRPVDKTPAELQSVRQDVKKVDINKPISIITFNIGYCGLDKNQDFFMDGGTKSRSSSRVQTQTNLNKIATFISNQNADAILLQEVDLDSTRSYHIDEYKYLKTTFRDYNSTFGVNYKVQWVPLPITDPMGSAYSGLASFTTYNVRSSTRYQYPGYESWPVQLFELDRCFVENRLPVTGGKELVLINSHLSAFDKGGEIRRQQLDYLKAYITGEYAKGNYVIVGGDWNQTLRDRSKSF
jgi:endonuclease/exonuclease/phosphatase family metal-dependent hydrolase